MPVGEIVTTQEMRLGTGIREFDRVLGGGVVPGSITLIGGDPGIGKTTLLLQALPCTGMPGTERFYTYLEKNPPAK